jgi:hypothetical protein
MAPHVTIILLNWNGWKDTLECLESVYQISYPSFNVVLVDNYSTDDSLTKIRDFCSGELNVFSELKAENTSKIIKNPSKKPIELWEFNESDLEEEPKESHFKKDIKSLSSETNIFLIKNNENHGFAGGNNVGIKFAKNIIKSDYVLLLNNDTVVENGFLEPMVEISENNKDIGFVGPKTYFYHPYPQKIIQITGGGSIDLKKAKTFQRGYQEEESGQYSESVDLSYVGGSCVLVKNEILNKIGLLDERFFMYWEDTDWSYRGNKKGYRSVYQPKSIIWHKHGASSKPCFELYYLSRNRIFFMKKNANSSEYRSFMFHFFTNVFWLDIWYYLVHLKDPKKVSCYLKGLKDGFKLKI